MLEETRLPYREVQSSSDEELMAHMRAGHHDAIAVILDRYQRLVWSVAQKILHDEGEAEDIVQVVFMELFQKMELFDPTRGTLRVWLLQLAYTRSINRRYHLQRRRFYSRVEVNEESVAQFMPDVPPALRLNAGESTQLVREGLGSLAPNQKVAVELIAFEGLTFEELAIRMEETIANAKHHYYRGMMKLRQYVSSPPAKEQRSEERLMTAWEMKDARPQSI